MGRDTADGLRDCYQTGTLLMDTGEMESPNRQGHADGNGDCQWTGTLLMDKVVDMETASASVQ